MLRHGLVEPIVFFTCASTFSALTILPEFVYQFVSESHSFTGNRSVSYCSDTQNSTLTDFDKVQIVTDEVSRWTQIASVLQSVMTAISVLVLTSWSEVIGRRNALLFPVIGGLLTSLTLVINVYFRISLVLYVVACAIYGASGGWSALINIGTAHLSDSVEQKQRGQRYTFLEVCASIGGGLGQIGTGIWVDYHGFLPPSIFLVFLSVMALIITLFLKTGGQVDPSERHSEDVALEDVDRTITEEAGTNHSKKQTNWSSAIFSQLREVIRIYTTNTIKCDVCKGDECKHCDGKSKSRVWRLWFYLVTYVVYMAAVDGSISIMTMFLVNMPLCFSPALVGIRSGLESFIVIATPLVIKGFRSVLNLSYQTILLTAIFGRIVNSMIMLLAKTKSPILIATALGALTNFTTPFIRVQISNLVSPSEQGPALALVPSVAKLVNIVSPLILLTVYPATIHIMPSFIWLVIIGYYIVPFGLMTVIWVTDKAEERAANLTTN